MSIGAPQIIMIVWMTLQLGFALAKNGEPVVDEKFSAGFTFIRLSLTSGVLCWGGFFG